MWKSIAKFNTLLQILCSTAVLISIIWPVHALILDGLKASVPAWLVVVAAPFCITFGAFITSRFFKSGSKQIVNKRTKLIEEILFDYTNVDPKQYGWTVRNDFPDTEEPIFKLHLDGQYGKTLEIIPNDSCYLEYKTSVASAMAQRVDVIFKPNTGWVIYCKIKIASILAFLNNLDSIEGNTLVYLRSHKYKITII